MSIERRFRAIVGTASSSGRGRAGGRHVLGAFTEPMTVLFPAQGLFPAPGLFPAQGRLLP